MGRLAPFVLGVADPAAAEANYYAAIEKLDMAA